MIRGDSSDGLPGIRGIGEKGAANIARTFSSLEEVVLAAQENDKRLSPNLQKKILESLDYARIATKLVSCALDVPVPNLSVDSPKKPKSLDDIESIKNEFGLGSSIDRIMDALGWTK
jgi:5'-3' exonuclease